MACAVRFMKCSLPFAHSLKLDGVVFRLARAVPIEGAEAPMFPIRNAVPFRYPPVITWMLIAINLFVLLIENSLSPFELEQFLSSFALIPARYSYLVGHGADISPADFLPFFTMMFLHGGWLHLILNMWPFWLFGPAIEDRLGPFRHLAVLFFFGRAAS